MIYVYINNMHKRIKKLRANPLTILSVLTYSVKEMQTYKKTEGVYTFIESAEIYVNWRESVHILLTGHFKETWNVIPPIKYTIFRNLFF